MNKILTRLLLLGLMLTIGGGIARADPFGDGVAAYDRGDYATAQRLWRPLAEQGDGLAQSNLARMYAKGEGVSQDYREAAKWYQLAAEQGLASAQSSLGLMYATGTGVPQDYGEAAKWCRLAAEQGDAPVSCTKLDTASSKTIVRR
jgi:TPR repeat protein